MVDHIVADQPDLVLDVASGTAGVAIQLADRTGARVIGLDLTLDMLRQGQRNVAEHLVSERVQLVAGRAEQTPFGDRRFDALTFTYLLRYVDDPQATLTELARLVKPGGAVASLEFLLPKSRFWRFWWWVYTRSAPSRRRLAHRRKGVVRGGPVPRSQHLGPLPALPGGVDGRGLEAGRLRRRRRAPYEPRAGAWSCGAGAPVRESPAPGGPHPEQRPSYYAARPGGWRDWWTLLHPPYTAWHLAYVVIGACLAPIVNVTRLIATLLAFFLAVGLAAHALDELHGRPLRTQIPRAALVAAAAGGSDRCHRARASPGSSRSGPALVPFLVVGPLLVVGYNFELLRRASSTTTSASRPAGGRFRC